MQLRQRTAPRPQQRCKQGSPAWCCVCTISAARNDLHTAGAGASLLRPTPKRSLIEALDVAITLMTGTSVQTCKETKLRNQTTTRQKWVQRSSRRLLYCPSSQPCWCCGCQPPWPAPHAAAASCAAAPTAVAHPFPTQGITHSKR